MRLPELINSGKFAIVADVTPPTGTDLSQLLEVSRGLASVADAIHIADGSGAVTTLSSLATCCVLEENGVDSVCQLSCRDRNRIALQADLLGAAVFGVENVVIVDGEHVRLGNQPHAKPVYDVDSIQLLQIASSLNAGETMAGGSLKGTPDTCLGTSVRASTKMLEAQVIKVEKRVEAGAKFLLTQPVFDASQFEAFRKAIEHIDIPVVVGIRLLHSSEEAKVLSQRLLIPETIIEDLASAEAPVEASMQIAAKLIREVRDMCQGVHIIAPGLEQRVPDILSAAGI